MESKVIGSKIAEARKRVKMSQAQLAERLFISPQAVGKWERGESMPDIITFNRLAEVLGVDLNYFSLRVSNTADGEDSPEERSGSEKSVRKQRWDMSRGNWMDADFSGLTGLHDKFGFSNMQRCKFIGSDMSGLDLKANHVDSCDFSDSKIGKSRFVACDLGGNKFVGSSLKEATFTGSDIHDCDFSGADLTGVTIKASSFSKNTLAFTKWIHTSFVNSHISDTVFDGAIDDCSFDNCSFKNVTFQNATLVSTFFKGRKLKGIRFVDCRADRLTYEFLKNGKADMTGIALQAP